MAHSLALPSSGHVSGATLAAAAAAQTRGPVPKIAAKASLAAVHTRSVLLDAHGAGGSAAMRTNPATCCRPAAADGAAFPPPSPWQEGQRCRPSKPRSPCVPDPAPPSPPVPAAVRPPPPPRSKVRQLRATSAASPVWRLADRARGATSTEPHPCERTVRAPVSRWARPAPASAGHHSLRCSRAPPRAWPHAANRMYGEHRDRRATTPRAKPRP